MASSSDRVREARRGETELSQDALDLIDEERIDKMVHIALSDPDGEL